MATNDLLNWLDTKVEMLEHLRLLVIEYFLDSSSVDKSELERGIRSWLTVINEHQSKEADYRNEIIEIIDRSQARADEMFRELSKPAVPSILDQLRDLGIDDRAH